MKQSTQVHYVLGHAGWIDHVKLSEAGKYGEQSKTPLKDMDYLVNEGFTATKEEFPILPSGAITPAFFMRLLAYQHREEGRKMSVHLHNVGCPDLTKPLTIHQELMDVHAYDWSISTPWSPCEVNKIKKGFFKLCAGDLNEEKSLSLIRGFSKPKMTSPYGVYYCGEALGKKMAEYLMDESPDKGDFVVSECIPGGTLLANSWMAVSEGWQGVYSGSLNLDTHPSVLKTKETLVDRLTSLLEIYTSDFSFTEEALYSMYGYMDVLMVVMLQAYRTCLDILTKPYASQGSVKNAEEAKRRRESLPITRTTGKITVAGGVQMLSTLFVYSKFLSEEFEFDVKGCIFDFFEVKTTKAVLSQRVSFKYLPDKRLGDVLHIPILQDDSWMVELNETIPYLQGYVGEGCGAGYALSELNQKSVLSDAKLMLNKMYPPDNTVVDFLHFAGRCISGEVEQGDFDVNQQYLDFSEEPQL